MRVVHPQASIRYGVFEANQFLCMANARVLKLRNFITRGG